ncbi:MAG: RluA family pseudouridine synthase, partial [Clostridia bacterium]
TVLKRYKNYTLMQFELKTGRTHQIRVHSKFIGHSIVGDDVYGGSNKFGLNGQLLHAFRLVLTHPKTNEVMTFEAPLPDYFKNVLESLQ